MGRGVGSLDAPVVVPGQKLPMAHHHGPYRHLSFTGGLPGLLQGNLHPTIHRFRPHRILNPPS